MSTMDSVLVLFAVISTVLSLIMYMTDKLDKATFHIAISCFLLLVVLL